MYDIEYYEKMLRKNSKTAEKISLIRWKFVSLIKPHTVLDYGSGVGWFRAYRPYNVEVDSYDIGKFPQTGILRDNYDLICFWDVFEHLPNLVVIEDTINLANFVALSIPIKPLSQPISSWVHFKPGEHLNYFTEESLNAIFNNYGFKRLVKASPECPPRKDILSLIYERI